MIKITSKNQFLKKLQNTRKWKILNQSTSKGFPSLEEICVLGLDQLKNMQNYKKLLKKNLF